MRPGVGVLQSSSLLLLWRKAVLCAALPGVIAVCFSTSFVWEPLRLCVCVLRAVVPQPPLCDVPGCWGGHLVSTWPHPLTPASRTHRESTAAAA